jgi:hypothetical protein
MTLASGIGVFAPSTVTMPRRVPVVATGAAWLNDNATTRATSVSMA